MSIAPVRPAPAVPVPVPSGNLAELLAATARAHGWLGRRAYVVEGRSYLFSEVHEGAGRAAAAFIARGLGPGSRILIAVPDGIDFVRAFLGALHIGAVAVPVNSGLHAAELTRAAALAEPAAIVSAPELARHFPAPLVLTPGELRTPSPGAPPYARVGADSLAFAAFTSGTTSDPRLCFHTHGDPEVFSRAAGEAIGIGPDDTGFSVSRLYFSYGLGNSLFFPLLRGATTVLSPRRATEDDTLKAVEEHGVTVLYGQPSFYARLLDHPAHGVLATLRAAVVAGEVLPPVLERRLRAILGDRLLNIFGTTEIGHALLANGPHGIREYTLGRVLPPYRLRIVDDHGDEVPAGTEGRLQVAGPTIGPGVARGGAEPARLTPDEWYTTGDAATVDADGYVSVHGRLDDIEIVGGQNVHPTEIEDLLTAHPAVREAAVVSVRRAGGATSLRAYAALHDGARPGAVTAELLATARSRLTWYKVPDDVLIVPELPRNPTGKLLRRAVRALAREGDPHS
ncbi:class I adenylate-forming enzyme family protein [Streptomyces uncialis]|uniref:class I adenylate-forming enzyme family protein n=1 Tax=Streptomyces uncialis TaxID=1048205 RepID=UPI002253795D|nr:AMP-binding protein [Streptomyces uncialis]MCX4660592.1 AMP-binding protein [Streptomyces uncialis]